MDHIMNSEVSCNEKRCAWAAITALAGVVSQVERIVAWRPRIMQGCMEGGVMLSEKGGEPSPPKPNGMDYVPVPISGYRLAHRLGRGHLPSPCTLIPDTRLDDHFSGIKKASQPVGKDVLRSPVSLFLLCGGQYDQHIHYAQLRIGIQTPRIPNWCTL